VNASKEPLRGFALHRDEALELALVQDGTGKTAREILNMDRTNRLLTALLRARYYKEQNDAVDDAGP